jgi:hypothetical protein
MTGLEPANGGTTNHCLNHLATLATEDYDSAPAEAMATSILTFGQIYLIRSKLAIARHSIDLAV